MYTEMVKPEKRKVGAALKELVKALDITYAQMARRLNDAGFQRSGAVPYSKVWLVSIGNDRAAASADFERHVSEAFGVPSDWATLESVGSWSPRRSSVPVVREHVRRITIEIPESQARRLDAVAERERQTVELLAERQLELLAREEAHRELVAAFNLLGEDASVEFAVDAQREVAADGESA